MYIDIGIGAILLIGFIIGLVRGFGKSIIKLISIVGAAVLTWRLTPYVMKFVFETDLFNQFVLGNGFSLRTLFDGTNIIELAQDSAFLKVVVAPLDAYIQAAGANVLTVEQYMPYLLAVFSATVLVSLLVYLVMRLLIMIVMGIIKAIIFKYKPRGISRFFGALVEVVNSAVLVLVIFMLSSSVVAMPTITSPVADQAKDSYAINYVYEFTVTNYNKYMVSENHLELDYLAKAIEQAEKDLASAQ